MPYLGIDSGGSKTIWRLINRNGEVLRNVVTTGMASVFPGMLPVREYTRQAFSELSQEEFPEGIYLSLGGPNTKEIDEALAEFWPGIPRTVTREASGECILRAAAFMGCTGAVLCGTGSTAVGIRNGKRCYAGGWGPVYGDEGSGGGLGQEALRMYLHTLNGTGESSELEGLFSFLTEGVDPSTFEGRMEVKRRAVEMNRRDLARLAPEIYRMAEMGNKIARQLYDQAAYDIARLAADVCDNDPEAAVLLCGGFPRNKETMLRRCGEYFRTLRRGKLVYDPRFNPITAACTAALDLYGGHTDPETFENILKEKGAKKP